MRQDVEQVKREIASNQNSDAQNAQGMSEKMAEMVQKMGERLKNDEMQNGISGYLKGAGQGGDANAIIQSQVKAINQVAFILDKMISQADLEKRLSLNKRTGNAPDKYKKSVREYLKSLSVEEK